MRHLLAIVISMAAAVGWAEPALQVSQVDGKPLVKAVTSRMVAWRPEADGLVVLIPADSGEVELGALPGNVSGEIIKQNGLVGVYLKGSETSWKVVQDGGNWLVRPGAGIKSQSLLMLADGWRAGGQILAPKSVTVNGKAWDVALVGSDMSVAGSVVGAVRPAGKARVRMEDIAAETVTPVAVKDVSKTALKALVQAAVQATPQAVSKNALPSLKMVATPDMDEASLPPLRVAAVKRAVSLSVVQPGAMLARGEFNDIEPAAGDVHEAAGRESPLAVPVALKKQVDAVAPVISATSGLAKVPFHEAPGMKPLSMSTAADEVLPQVLGEIYVPGTIVSLTMPEEQHGGLSHEAPIAAEVSPAVVAAEISATLEQAQVSKTWNQVTLEPIQAALEQAKVTPTAVEPVAEVKHAVADEGSDVTLNRLFPQKGEHYFDQMADALQAVAAAPDGSSRAKDAQLALAQVYLIWQRPEEALSVLDALPHRADGLPASPQGRLYQALAHISRGDDLPEKQWNALLDLGGSLGPHGKLWKAVVASQKEDYATALKEWPEERGILPQYPAYMRASAQLAQATALVMVGDRGVAKSVVDELVDGYKNPDEVPVGLVRLRGLVRLGTPDEAEGLEYLAAAAESDRDLAQAYRAKYEFVRALHQRRDLSDEQVQKYLSDLWLDWRGDGLEHDVLETLASLYDKNDQPREALQHWQVLVKAFPKSTNLNEVTQRMTDAFLRVFDPENPKIYDLLAYVGLYYDFSELVPNDERGDAVQEQIARMLVNANLWDRAVPILEQQLDHRPLDPASQGRLALMLAECYGNLGKAADGIKVLDKWQKVANTIVLSRAWRVQEAKLMLQLDRPTAATKALASLPADDTEARDLRIEAVWAAKDWKGSVPLLQERLATVPASQLVSDTGAQLATFRLSYAYGQLKDEKGLNELSERYGAMLQRLPQLSDDIGAVAAGTGISASVVAAGPLAPLTGALNDLNRLTDRVASVRASVATERQQQQEYNDKMRYMDLLPPPAL